MSKGGVRRPYQYYLHPGSAKGQFQDTKLETNQMQFNHGEMALLDELGHEPESELSDEAEDSTRHRERSHRSKSRSRSSSDRAGDPRNIKLDKKQATERDVEIARYVVKAYAKCAIAQGMWSQDKYGQQLQALNAQPPRTDARRMSQPSYALGRSGLYYKVMISSLTAIHLYCFPLNCSF